jgi:hypothetical protein
MDRKPLPKTCWICGKVIALETCTVDEHGMGVHENCYVAKLSLNGHRPPAPDSGLTETRISRHRRLII